MVTLDSGVVLDLAYAGDVRVALSPNGRLLAIGNGSPNRETGTLTVVDVATATVVRRWTDLPIELSSVSSMIPSVEVSWCDDATVVCSETRLHSSKRHYLYPEDGEFVFVRRSLATGAVTSEARYGPIGGQHKTPPGPGPQPPARATFSTEVVGEYIHLLRAGCTEPAAKLVHWYPSESRMEIAPDGESAFVYVGSKSRALLFTAALEGGRLLCDGWARDPVWLRIGDTSRLWLGPPRSKAIPNEPRGTH